MNSIISTTAKSLSSFFILALIGAFGGVMAQPSMLAPIPDVCGNVSSVTLSGGTPLGGTYFGPGVTGTTFDPTAAGGPGVYQIGYGFVATDTAYQNVTVTAVTPADFSGLDPEYCLGDTSTVTLTPIFPLASGNFGPSSLVSGNTFIMPSAAGNYTVYYFYTDANGCSDTSFKPVTIRPKPAVNFTLIPTQTSVCDKDPAFVISKTSSNPTTGSFSGTGVVGGNIFDPSLSGAGTFKLYYTATGTFGCENVDSSQSITVNVSPTVSFTLPVDSICRNAPPIFLPNGVVGGVPTAGTYSGPGVSANAPYKFDPFGSGGVGNKTITFTGTANGCSNTATRTIRVDPFPTVTFNNLYRKCANDTVFILNNATPAGGTYSGVGVLPDGVSYDPSITPGPGQYQLTYMYVNEFGCSDTNSQLMTLDTFPEVSITSVPAIAKICLGDTIDLNASSSTSNDVTFTWTPFLGDISPFAGSPAVGVGDNVTFFPTLTRSITLNGRYVPKTGSNPPACINRTSLEVQVIQPAMASVAGDFEICFGDTTTLTASGASTYNWSTGDMVDVLKVAPVWDTTYSVIALSELDGNGKQCSSDTTEVKVIVNSLPIISAGLDRSAFIGDLIELEGRGGDTYVWSGALDEEDFVCNDCEISSVRVFPEDSALSITYYVIGTDTNGCKNTDSLVVSIDENVIVFVPTAFSPNNDGVNDSLFVRAKGVESFTFQIFNRRGEEVFTTKSFDEGWDGSYEGEPMNQEVFVYFLQATPYIRRAFKQTGSITLVR